METLFVQLNPDRESAQWLVLDDKDQPHATVRQGPLSSLKDFAKQRRVVCTLGSQELLLTQVALPHSRNRRKIQQAIPYALEDELADDIDLLHFAIGKEQPQPAAANGETAQKLSNIPVAVINKESLRGWLNALNEAGVKPHALIPDILFVPLATQEWSVALNGHSALLRTGPFSGLACDPENLPVILDTALDQPDSPSPQQIRVWNHNEEVQDIKLRHESVAIDNVQAEQGWLNTLARGYNKATQINLLQGEFSFREEYGKLLKPWRVPAILLAALLLLLLVGKGIENIQLQKQSDLLSDDMITVYLQVFPNSRNFDDLRFQLEQKLKELGAGEASRSDFLLLLNNASKHIGASKNAKIKSITYNGEHLDVELTVGAVADMDQLKQAVEAENLQAEINSISTEGDKVSAQLRVSKP